MRMQADEIKRLSGRINRMLPDDATEAVAVLALNYAHVIVATGCDDDSALEAVRRALKQMRVGDWWKSN